MFTTKSNPILAEFREMVESDPDFILAPLDWWETVNSDMSAEANAYQAGWTIEHWRHSLQVLRKLEAVWPAPLHFHREVSTDQRRWINARWRDYRAAADSPSSKNERHAAVWLIEALMEYAGIEVNE